MLIQKLQSFYNLRKNLQFFFILKNYINSILIFNNNILLDINIHKFIECMYVLKNYSFFKYDILINMFCSSSNNLDSYFVYYNLISTKYNSRLFLRVHILKSKIIPSLISMYPSANWLEREIWDFFGIFFRNHNDLRRILTDYGFEGNPLLKNYPVVGFYECEYQIDRKSVGYVFLEESQELRWYKYPSPWDKSFFQ
jgi:NADH-quinone oxidoreductase subunit C